MTFFEKIGQVLTTDLTIEFKNKKNNQQQESTFLQLQKKRRSIYALGSKVALSQSEIEQLIQETVAQTPSAFHSQSARIIMLFANAHLKFWDIVREELRKLIPSDVFEGTNVKIDGFAAGYGTVLFYEDLSVIKGLQKQYPLYADNFPIWSEQSAGMVQYAVWMALAEHNIGGSLQHYNPLIDQRLHQVFDVPDNWFLRAQLVFGSQNKQAPEKHFIEDEVRFKTYTE